MTVYIIDYKEKNLFEIFHDSREPVELRNGQTEFSIDPNQKITIDCIPESLEYKQHHPKTISHYSNGTEIIDMDEYKRRHGALRETGFYNDDDDFIFETREDKKRYDEFIVEWEKVYNDEYFEWIDRPFKIIYKQHIPERYSELIQSQVLFRFSNTDEPVKAICEYRPSFEWMMREIGSKLGFEEVVKDTFSKNTKGKKYSLCDGITYSKVNDSYVTSYFKDKRLFFAEKGTYDQCVTAFERDYSAIQTYLKLVKAQIDQIPINTTTAKEIIDELGYLKQQLNRIEPKNSHRTQFFTAVNKIDEINEKLTNSI
jgi:hypothetical protein